MSDRLCVAASFLTGRLLSTSAVLYFASSFITFFTNFWAGSRKYSAPHIDWMSSTSSFASFAPTPRSFMIFGLNVDITTNTKMCPWCALSNDMDIAARACSESSPRQLVVKLHYLTAESRVLIDVNWTHRDTCLRNPTVVFYHEKASMTGSREPHHCANAFTMAARPRSSRDA